MKKWVKIFLFISSYTPLFAILILKNIKCLNNRKVIILIILFSSFIILSNMILFYILNNHIIAPKQLKIKKVTPKNNETLNYIVSYIIPFIGFELSNIYDILSIMILFFIIGWIYINSNLIFMNPILNLLKYNIYELTDEYNNSYILISKKIINKSKINSFILYEKIADNVILEANLNEK
ncbi:hypothetical protein [Thermoanaerobacterium thermosaccharolyticum]|uniref:hypothetical protein n=1 Tax=Thermoanaerobacterium thermosaccharolyticum TaxID=1517 RepID=UPI0020A5B4E3|nr:hypothetical protein [Thermoanaerobacterium thermosaccharolyticum]MCP2241261.1 hypothetical protein [Thermoanaerobacterium thermosaccharolyticum]